MELNKLLRSGSEGTRSTRRLTRKLIRLTIETGTVTGGLGSPSYMISGSMFTITMTAAMAMLTVVLVMFGGKKAYYQVTAGVVSKLYSNTLLASLNGRMDVTTDQETHPNISLSFDFPKTQEREIRSRHGGTGHDGGII